MYLDLFSGEHRADSLYNGVNSCYPSTQQNIHSHLFYLSLPNHLYTIPMDSYCVITPSAPKSASSHPEELVLVDQDGGGGNTGLCTIA